MAITFVGSIAYQSNGGTFDLAPPANMQQGDILMVWGLVRSGTVGNMFHNDSGWNELRRIEGNGENTFGGEPYVAYRFMGSSIPSTYSFTTTIANNWAMGMIAYRGVDTFSPFQCMFGSTIGSMSLGSGGSFPVPPVFCEVPGKTVVLGVLNHNLNTSPVATFTHATLTNRLNGTGSANRCTVFAFDGDISSTTSVSYANVTANRSDGSGGACTFVLRDKDRPGLIQISPYGSLGGNFNNNSDPFSIAVPNNARRGDFLLMVQNSENGETATTTPDWTQLCSIVSSGGVGTRQAAAIRVWGQFWDGVKTSWSLAPSASTWGTNAWIRAIRNIPNMPVAGATANGGTAPAVSARNYGFIMRLVCSNTLNNNNDTPRSYGTTTDLCMGGNTNWYRVGCDMFIEPFGNGASKAGYSGDGLNDIIATIAFPLEMNNNNNEASPTLVMRR